MKPLTITKPKDGPSAEQINAAYDDFCQSTVTKALIIGQLLREKRLALSPSSHSEKTGRFEGKSEDDKFSNWLKTHCPRISQATAYRWMDMADRVAQAVLAKQFGKDQIEAGVIEVEGAVVPVSHMLTAPKEELPKQAQEAQQLLLDFVSGKTMKDCMASVIVEGKDPHAITRAHNGATRGGAGGDRKAVEEFIARDLGKMTTFFGYKLSKGQTTAIGAAFQAEFPNWPRWILEIIVEAAKEELKLSDAQRAARIGKEKQ